MRNVDTTPDTDPRHVAIYLRVSTDQQDTKSQERGVHALAAREFPDVPIVEYRESVSAFKNTIFERPESRRMVDAIEAGRVVAIVVDTQDRLSRGEMFEWADFQARCVAHNTRIVTVQNGELTSEFTSQILSAIAAIVARKESADKSHRVKRGKAALARAGKWPFGRVAPGYRLGENGALEATEDLPLIAKMFRLFLDGQSYKQLGNFLNAQLSNEALDRTKHGRINHDWIRLMLKNPVYTGRIRVGDELIDAHEAAVDLLTFDRVQQRLERLATENYRPPKSWALSGFARCGECHRALGLKTTRRPNGAKHNYLRCQNDRCTRKGKLIPATPFETSFILHIGATAATIREGLAQDAGWGVVEGPTQEQREAAQAALAAATERVNEMTALVKARAITTNDPDFLSAIAERDAAETAFYWAMRQGLSEREALANLATEIEELAAHAPTDPEIFRMSRTVTHARAPVQTVFAVLDGWNYANFELRRAMLENVVSHIYVNTDSFEIRYHHAIPEPLNIDQMFVSRDRGTTKILRNYEVCLNATSSR